MRARGVFAAFSLAWLAGCAARAPYPPPDAPLVASIYVVARGWHTEIVMRRADVAPGTWPEVADFPAAEYLMVGWGDRDYYPATEFNLWYGIKALFWPTPSVLHVVGFNAPPAQRFPYGEVVELRLTRAGLERLSAYIGASYERNGAARAAPLLPSPYEPGWFYPSVESFHLFRTCNVWVAAALRAAGLPVRPFLAVTTESVMKQVRGIGRGVQSRSAANACDAPPASAAEEACT